MMVSSFCHFEPAAASEKSLGSFLFQKREDERFLAALEMTEEISYPQKIKK
jgi:hypothetical protein